MTPNQFTAYPASLGSTQALSLDYKLVVAFLTVVMLEGAIGKWVSGPLEYPAVALRDVIAIAIIARAALSRSFSQLGDLPRMLTAWSVVLITWSLIQALLNQSSILVAVIGIRFWVLYLWLTLAICALFTQEDYQRICKLLVVFAVLSFPLIAVQHFSPPDSFINLASGEGQAFLLGGNIVRPPGTFSFTMGYTCFLAAVSPLFLSAEEGQHAKTITSSHKMVLLLVMLSSAFLSGSRNAMIFSALLYTASLLLQLMSAQSKQSGRALVSLAVVAFAGFIAPIIVSDSIYAIEDRFQTANDSEDPFSRIISMVIGGNKITEEFSILGVGLGFSANMASKLTQGEMLFLTGETEPERLLLSGGLVGIIWMIIKYFIAGWGLLASFRRFLVTREIRPFLLWITTANVLATWPMSGQLSVHAFGHVLLALSLMSLGLHKYPSQELRR